MSDRYIIAPVIDELAALHQVHVGDVLDAEMAEQPAMFVFVDMLGEPFVALGWHAVPFRLAKLVGEEIVGLQLGGLDVRPRIAVQGQRAHLEPMRLEFV